MYGKDKGNRKVGQKFSEWVQEGFPGLRQNDAAAAMWYASNSTNLVEIPAGMSHPESIRAWARDQEDAQALPADLLEVTPQSTVKLDSRGAERVAKVALRAASGDEGADILRTA
jgi:hypothetical protein